MSSISHYFLGKTNQNARYDIDWCMTLTQNYAALGNGSGQQIRTFNLQNGFGVGMILF